MESKISRLERAEKLYREQLRNERLKREEAERRLYSDRQGAIKRNIRSIMVLSPSSHEGDEDKGLLHHYKNSLDDAEICIKRLETDLLKELETRQQLEKTLDNVVRSDEVYTGGDKLTPPSFSPVRDDVNERHFSASGGGTSEEYRMKITKLEARINSLETELEDEKTAHIRAIDLNSQKETLTSPARDSDGSKTKGDDPSQEDCISVPRLTMQTIREQLISLSAERDALRDIGDGSSMLHQAMEDIATSSSMLNQINDQETSGNSQSPFHVGRLKEMIKSRDLINIKLVEALRREKAKVVSMEVMISEQKENSDSMRNRHNHVLKEQNSLVNNLREQLEQEKKSSSKLSAPKNDSTSIAEIETKLSIAIGEKEKAIKDAKEMRANLNEIVSELMEAKVSDVCEVHESLIFIQIFFFLEVTQIKSSML